MSQQCLICFQARHTSINCHTYTVNKYSKEIDNYFYDLLEIYNFNIDSSKELFINFCEKYTTSILQRLSIEKWKSYGRYINVILSKYEYIELLWDYMMTWIEVLHPEVNIKKCKVVIIGSYNIDETNKTECPICYDPLTLQNKTKLNCGHVFCQVCIVCLFDKQIENNGICCSLCRRPTTNIEVSNSNAYTNIVNSLK